MVTQQDLTIHISAENLDFLNRFALRHGLTVAEVLDRYLTRLREASRKGAVHPKVERISGIVPSELEASNLRAQHLAKKHG